jgi:hypothetical protein
MDLQKTKLRMLPKKLGLLINRNFALLWVGQAISFTGDDLFYTTLVLWIATQVTQNQAWTPLAVSGVMLTAAIPMLVIAPIAGVLVDGWDNKRKTMLWMYALSGGLVLLLLPLTGIVQLPLIDNRNLPILWKLGAIYSVTLLVGTLAQFFNPSEMALLSDIVEEPYLTRATGLHHLTLSLANLLGPTLAALIYFSLGVQWALLLEALSFGLAWCSILAIRVPLTHPKETDPSEKAQRKSFGKEFVAGLRFLGPVGYSSRCWLPVFCLSSVGVFATRWAFSSWSRTCIHPRACMVCLVQVLVAA